MVQKVRTRRLVKRERLIDKQKFLKGKVLTFQGLSARDMLAKPEESSSCTIGVRESSLGREQRVIRTWRNR